MEESMESAGATHRVMTVDEALETIYAKGSGWWIIKGTIISAIAASMLAVETNMVTFLTYCSEAEWDLSDVYGDVLVGAVVVGVIIGTLFWSPFGDMFGRWKTICVTMTCLVILGIASAFAPNFWSFVVLRALVGFFEGGWTVALSYILELVPTGPRGALSNSANVAWGFGSVSVAGLAWLLIPSLGWRYFTGLAVVPFVVNLVFIYQLCESPRWLVSQGRYEDALKSLAHIARVNGCVMPCDGLEKSSAEDDTLVTGKEEPSIFGYYQKMMGKYSMLFSAERLPTSLKIWASMSFIMGGYSALVLFDVDVLAYDLSFVEMLRVLPTSALRLSRGIMWPQPTLRVHPMARADSSSSSDTSLCSFDYSYTFWVATSEIVGSILVTLILDRPDIVIGGRSGVTKAFLCVAAVAALVSGYNVEWRFLWAYVARGMACGASGAFNIQVPELYGTAHRVTGAGAASLACYPALALATLLVYSGWSTFTMMSITSVALVMGMVCASTLPETADTALK